MEHTKQIFTKMFIKCTFKFKLSTRYCFCFLLLRFSATKHILHGLKPAIYPVQPGNNYINQFKLHNFVIFKAMKKCRFKTILGQ